MKQKLFSKTMALLITFALLLSFVPVSVFAGEHDGQVHVIVENTTYSEEDGAPWDGVLVDKWVTLEDSSTMMSCVVAALGDIPQEGAENNYISSINGLSAFDGGDASGWMGTLNDWFTNYGFGDFTVAAGTLSAYDEIRIMYTSEGYGADLGGTWDNNDKSVKNVVFSAGALNTGFDKDTHSYTLTLPEDVSSLIVTPTATNKNFQVRTSIGTTEYKRTASVPVTDGTVITVKCGDPSWPTMNFGSESVEAETYTFTVKVNHAPSLKAGVTETTQTVITHGETYTLDLSTVFEDTDGDALTYSVKTDGGETTAAEKNYSFKPGAAGTYTLEFTASDGSATSKKHTVTLVSNSTVSYNVVLSMQDKNEFILLPQTVTVSSDLAESYGFEDNVYNSVSTLDVLVKAQELTYKTDFTKETAADYLVVKSGTISKVNGIKTYSFSFAVNGAFPYDENSEYGAYGYTGYNVAQAAVAKDDMVDFFFYQDSMCMDYYAWFEQDGARVDELNVKTNEEFNISLKGFMYMFGSYTKEDLIKMNSWGPIEDAKIALVNETTGKLTAIENIVTDARGNVKLTFSQAGTYYVSAYTVYDDAYTYITSPYLKVTVRDDRSGAETLTIRTSTSTANLSNAILAGANEENVAVFDRKTLTYDLGDILLDTNTQLRFWYTLAEAKTKVELKWSESGSKVLTANTSTSTNISNVWANCLSAGKNVITMTVTPPAGSFNEEVTYTFKVNCKPTLTAMSAASGETALYLDKTFAAAANEYTLTVPSSAETVNFAVTPKNADYTVSYNGKTSSAVNITGKDKVEITVAAGSGADAVVNKYTVNLNKVDKLSFKPVVTPSDAVISVYDQNGAAVQKNPDGSYDGLFGAAQYTYTATKYGYVSVSGNVPSNGGAIEITLKSALDDGLADVSADWENFRNSDTNMGITSLETPVAAEDTALLWNKKLGTGWSAAPSVQIIVDNALVVMSNKTIYKLDLETGEILAQGEMSAAPNFGYTPPTYAEGMIFAPLANGTVQAFNAKTLESLWIYNDPLKGQALSPITYSDGYIYTGFWNGETNKANFVCLSVTDEDPNNTSEAKTASWRHSQPGGFYWAGSAVIGNYVVVGTDDGSSGSSNTSAIMSFNKYSGEKVSSLMLENAGDQRSSIAYDAAKGKIYFTTKGGYLYSAAVNKTTGAISELKGVNYNAQSTSTPIVYGGSVYFGTGSGISSTGSSGNFVCADAETLEMKYAIGLKGYPQCSMLLSTAYEETGYLYFYSTYNATPGGISMLKVKTGANSADDCELIELYDAAGFSQYCITSIICGSDGTLYYKNDSANVLAVGVPKATTVINLIKAIGTVDINSGSAIDTARKAYDALGEADKAKVTNYKTLTDAENAFNKLKADEVTALINAISTVTLNSEESINKAVTAHNALTDAQKLLVTNFNTLTAAQAKLSELKVSEAQRLINAISDPVTLKNEADIVAARSYYTGLTSVEQAKVTNYAKLTAAETALEKLKKETAGGSTKSVTVKINGVTYEVSKETKAAVEAIEKLLSGVTVIDPTTPTGKNPTDGSGETYKPTYTDEEIQNILEAYKKYAALTDDEKLFVKNFPELEQMLTKLGAQYHYDFESGIDARKNAEEVLPWNIKMNVSPKVVSEEQLNKIRETLGEEAQFILLYDISFTDVLTGKEWHPTSLINVRIPAPDTELDTITVVHIKDDGSVEYIQGKVENGMIIFDASDFSLYGVAAFNGTWEDMLPTSAAPTANNVSWIWIAIGVLAIAALVTLFILKKRQTAYEEE